LPLKYLGVPVTFFNLKNIDWEILDAKLVKKLDAWIYDSAYSGARLTLDPRIIQRRRSASMEASSRIFFVHALPGKPYI
jgi:hypothetical protein